MNNIKNFVLEYDFNGDIDKFLLDIKNGNAIKYNDIPLPIDNAYIQGRQVILPLPHRNIIIDLNPIYELIKNNKTVRITINIVK